MKLYKSYTICLPTGCGNLYATHGIDKNGIHEILLTLGKSGGCVSAHLSAYAHLLTITMNAENPLYTLTKCAGIKCIYPPCCIDVVARYFIEYILNKKEVI